MSQLTTITFDPNVMGGQACIRGMRIPVATIIKLTAAGMGEAEPEDIYEALRYMADLAQERLVGSWGWCASSARAGSATPSRP